MKVNHPRHAVATPHHLATSIANDVLHDGGNAVDAAVAANLALGVVMPYACGFGGDLFAMVWDGSSVTGLDASGRSPAAATVEAVLSRTQGGAMPVRGPLSITVPGAVDGWFRLLERFGTRSFGVLAGPAVRLAAQGFALDDLGTRSLTASARSFGHRADWCATYGSAAADGFLAQPDLALTILALADQGSDAFYRGRIARRIAEHVESEGGLLSAADLAAHEGTWVAPLVGGYREHDVFEFPPPTQGVTALEAFAMLDHLGSLPTDPVDRAHLLIEVSKLALVDRHRHVTDPDHLERDMRELFSPSWVARRAGEVDRRQAASPAPARPVPGGTTYLCTADDDGMIVSLSQSNFMGFGSGVHVPGTGINLHNRGAYFRLDGQGADVLAPNKKPLHTLIPAMLGQGGVPSMAFGTMGGDDQVQIQLQLLAGIIDDGRDLQDAIDMPRWSLSPHDWSVSVEDAVPGEVVDGLRARGHKVDKLSGTLGWAQAIRRSDDGWEAASDPRSNGGTAGA